MFTAALAFVAPMATNAEVDLSWLAPVATAAASVLVALIGGAALIRSKRAERRDALEDKALDKEPTETDAYAEVRLSRNEASHYYRLFRLFEDLFYTTHAALRHLARIVHDNHPAQVLDDDIVKALALRPPEDLDKV